MPTTVVVQPRAKKECTNMKQRQSTMQRASLVILSLSLFERCFCFGDFGEEEVLPSPSRSTSRRCCCRRRWRTSTGPKLRSSCTRPLRKTRAARKTRLLRTTLLMGKSRKSRTPKKPRWRWRPSSELRPCTWPRPCTTSAQCRSQVSRASLVYSDSISMA